MLKDPVYKGEFAAFRMKQITVIKPSKDGFSSQLVKIRVERPPEEWIIVPVPAIVSAEVWELANQVLEKNQLMSSRNGMRQYLLTGLVRCAHCGFTYSGWAKKLKRRGKVYDLPAYRCSTKCLDKHEQKRIGCEQSVISCRVLEDAVWSVMSSLMLEPNNLISVLESEFQGEGNKQFSSQAQFLEDQIEENTLEDEKLYRAYVAGVFDEAEYAERRKLLKEKRRRLSEEVEKVKGRIMTQIQFEEQKQLILTVSESVRQGGLVIDAPFEVKKQILKIIVDQIILDTREGWFRIEGAFPGTYWLKRFNNNSNDPNGGNLELIVNSHSAVATRSRLPG